MQIRRSRLSCREAKPRLPPRGSTCATLARLVDGASLLGVELADPSGIPGITPAPSVLQARPQTSGAGLSFHQRRAPALTERTGVCVDALRAHRRSAEAATKHSLAVQGPD